MFDYVVFVIYIGENCISFHIQKAIEISCSSVQNYRIDLPLADPCNPPSPAY